MFPMMFLSGSFFPLEMMPDFLQSFAKTLPLYYLNEGLRASMVLQDNVTALSYAAIIGALRPWSLSWAWRSPNGRRENESWS
jgi:ABC-2 type transport system permease protein